MNTFDEITSAAKASLSGRVDPITTTALAGLVSVRVRGVTEREIFDTLRMATTTALANYARRGEPRAGKMFGKPVVSRPWLWADFGLPNMELAERKTRMDEAATKKAELLARVRHATDWQQLARAVGNYLEEYT